MSGRASNNPAVDAIVAAVRQLPAAEQVNLLSKIGDVLHLDALPRCTQCRDGERLHDLRRELSALRQTVRTLAREEKVSGAATPSRSKAGPGRQANAVSDRPADTKTARRQPKKQGRKKAARKMWLTVRYIQKHKKRIREGGLSCPTIAAEMAANVEKVSVRLVNQAYRLVFPVPG